MGIERQEVIRHARWDAEREDLLLQKKAGLLPHKCPCPPRHRHAFEPSNVELHGIL